MTTALANITDTVAQLQQRLAALGDIRDRPSENEQIAFRLAYDSIQGAISGLNNVPDDLAKAQARLDEWKARWDAFVAKEQEIEQQIADAPDPQTIADGRARDKEVDRQWFLAHRLRLLRDGTLIITPGVTLGTRDHIEMRLRELTDLRDRAQAALDGHLRTAEQLLS